jgi:hypothetical protein
MGRHSPQMQASDQCKHPICEQQPQIAANDQTFVHAQSIAALHAIISVVIFPTSTRSVALGSVDTSPERVPLLAANPTVLRV